MNLTNNAFSLPVFICSCDLFSQSNVKPILLLDDMDIISTNQNNCENFNCSVLLNLLDGILSKTNSYAPEKLIVSKREFEDITFAMGKPKEETTYFSNDDSWELEVKEFIEAIKNDTSIINGTIDDAINTFNLVQKIYSSVKK